MTDGASVALPPGSTVPCAAGVAPSLAAKTKTSSAWSAGASTATAVSSTVAAPMSSPQGAKTRAIPSSSTPASRSRAVRTPLLAFAGLVQTIPALALLALFYPALLILGQTPREDGDEHDVVDPQHDLHHAEEDQRDDRIERVLQDRLK